MVPYRDKLTRIWQHFLYRLLLVNRVQVKLPNESHGSGYGGWCVSPVSFSKETVVYSFGVGEDISFDLSLINQYGVNVFGFDPTPKSVNWIKAQQIPSQFHFLEYGIANYDGVAKFYLPANPDYVSHSMIKNENAELHYIEVPVYRLNTIMAKLGHPYVDILKMDIEGAEYSVIEDVIESNLKPTQLLVEFHHRFKNIGVLKTVHAIQSLNRYGYRIFSISDSGEEYSFVRLSTVISDKETA